ncbi:hypothetical protein [Kineosporia sp. NBRC 101731]|uniref:hypothetical protein n=1 Tax=Kineosporia sp. NBRC 101731 TaxID=3032199 RepID=UPI0024A46614|nr:hypothetical protein [Kineosporia sp. NBRC 101731]GLY33801.1 hypothetical protein Kisp02_71660 [Kineosporia sp. NBRC 101731]
MEDPERLLQAAVSTGLRVYAGRALSVPPTAMEVKRTITHPKNDLHGFVDKVLMAGIDREAVRAFQDLEEYAFYWTIDLADGRSVVFTNDTEEYVVWMEGPWPLAATFKTPTSAYTEVDFDSGELIKRVVAWCKSP